jgi:undecaprenyl diphosphate synthase
VENITDFHPDNSGIPGHVGLIPDGGRRWAVKHNVGLEESYHKTKLFLAEICSYLFDVGVNEISIYLSSIQNFRRQQTEIDAFNTVSEIAFGREILQLAESKHVRVVFAGNRDILPRDYLKAIEIVEAKTSGFKNGAINLCIAYNPIEELYSAFSKSETNNEILKNLWVKTPLHLIIRSGGANLLSNFLPLQSGFARLYFLDDLFNDLTINNFKAIIYEFSMLDRKFGT